MGSKKNKRKSAQAGSVATEIRSVNPAPGYSVDSTASDGKPSFWSTKYFEWLVLAVASVISYWILTARLVGVSVSVLVDEYSYVLDTHYRGLTDSFYPNHLFQLAFAPTKLCGPEFYSCARSLNAVFVLASGILVYYLVKRLSGRIWLGGGVWAATVFGSFGTYTAYFMPEAISNFFMILFFYVVIRLWKSQKHSVWLLAGSALGIAALAKPHAFFVFPAIIIFILLSSRSLFDKFFFAFVIRTLFFVASFFVVKFSIGFAIAGDKGLSLFGFYGGTGTAVDLVENTILENSTLENLLVTSWGQTLMTLMILGVAVPVAITGLLDSVFGGKLRFETNSFRSLFAITLLNMMAVSALFEAWQNLTGWMHTRYHSYLIPLALVVLVEAYMRAKDFGNKLIQRVIVGIFVIISTINLITAAVPYGANWIDAPDFKTHIDHLVLSSIATVISIGLAVWWLWGTKVPLISGLVLMVGSSVFSGSHITTFLVANFGKDTSLDHLSRVLRDYIPQDELDKSVVVGESHTNVERVLFGSLSGGAKLGQVGEAGFDISNIGPEVNWVVNAGENVVRGFGPPHISGPGFAIYSTNEANRFIPRNNDVLSMAGLCLDRAWGCGNEVQVKLDSKIGRAGVVDLILDVSEIASKGNIEFVAGDVVLAGQLPPGLFALSLSFPGQSEIGNLIIRAGLDSEAARSGPADKFVRVVSVNINNR